MDFDYVEKMPVVLRDAYLNMHLLWVIWQEVWYHILPCIMCTHTYVHIIHSIPLLCPWYVIIIPIYNVQPYISLKNVGKKNAYYTQQNTVSFSNCVNKKRKQKRKIFGYIQQVGENLANCWIWDMEFIVT